MASAAATGSQRHCEREGTMLAPETSLHLPVLGIPFPSSYPGYAISFLFQAVQCQALLQTGCVCPIQPAMHGLGLIINDQITKECRSSPSFTALSHSTLPWRSFSIKNPVVPCEDALLSQSKALSPPTHVQRDPAENQPCTEQREQPRGHHTC